MNNKPHTTYTKRADKAAAKVQKTRKRIYHIGTLKLLVFVGAVAAIVYYWQWGWHITLPLAMVVLVAFLVLSKIHSRLFQQKAYWETMHKVNEQELKTLAHDYADRDNGQEFIDPTHLYTYDLDVFGNGSLFQYINRSATQLGKYRLAHWLTNHLKQKTEIEHRQEAVKELTPDIELRQHFLTTGLLHKSESKDRELIEEWAKAPSHFRRRIIVRWLPYAALGCNALLLLLALMNVVPYSIPAFTFTAFMILSSGLTKQISKLQNSYSKKHQVLSTYAQLIEIIEKNQFHSTPLIALRQKVENGSNTASKAVKRLSKLMHALDQRYNIAVLLILNGLFFWELWQFMKIEQWKEENADNLPRWMEAITELDAYCSLATFAYNHPHYSYPEICNNPFIFEAQCMGHPLMSEEKCVLNPIEIPKCPYFLIVTGANMAGKSTYLRTIGINYLLACIGSTVWGENVRLYPSQLITSLRTTDSLKDNESYFFSELKRLKLIIDKLKNGERLFIILDEILKGTNSIDKQKGSLALIKQFMKLRTNGIIATHDLQLGTLIEEFPNNIRNYCFEANIKNEELDFSYLLCKGVAQNMNACFLMEKMGIAME